MKTSIILTLIVTALLLSSCADSAKKSTYLPTAKNINVKTYKFGIHPYLNSKKMHKSYRPILDFIEDKIGDIEIVLETSATYAEYNTKLYRGDFDFSLPNPLQTYNAISTGYTVVAKMKPDTVFRGIIISRKDSNIKTVDQLKGKSISFPAKTALAATMMPLLYLHEHGLNTEKDIEKKYVGSHFSAILNTFSSDTIACATWPPPWELWKRENPIKAQRMEVIWETKPLINNGLIVKSEIKEEIVNQLVDILVGLDKTKKGKELLDNAGFHGFERSTNIDYDLVKEFMIKYEKSIGINK